MSVVIFGTTAYRLMTYDHTLATVVSIRRYNLRGAFYPFSFSILFVPFHLFLPPFLSSSIVSPYIRSKHGAHPLSFKLLGSILFYQMWLFAVICPFLMSISRIIARTHYPHQVVGSWISGVIGLAGGMYLSIQFTPIKVCCHFSFNFSFFSLLANEHSKCTKRRKVNFMNKHANTNQPTNQPNKQSKRATIYPYELM